MAITGSRSTFPTTIDVFPEYQDLSPSEIASAQRWQTLKLQISKTTAEWDEFNTLTTQLSSKIFTPESLNKISDVAFQLETFFKNSVEGYITTKQNEFNATLSNFSDQGMWSNTTTYKKWNTVQYNDEIYLSKKDINLNNTPVGDINDLWWYKIAKRGIQGIPGMGLSFIGDYNNSYMYSIGNAVRYDNNIYYCISSSIGNLPTNITYWQLFLSDSGIAIQSSPPSSPYTNMVWIDTSNLNQIKYYDGSAWQNIGTIASKISIVDSGNLITATDVEGALQECFNKTAAHLTNDMLKYDCINGTTQTPTIVNGQITQIEHKDDTNITVRTDTFTYTNTLITEIRTLSTGQSLTLKYYFNIDGSYNRTEVI
jgi:hypothetical protein